MIKKNVMNFLRHQFLQKKSQKYQIFIRKVIKIPLLKSFFTKDTFTTCHVFSSICVCLILTIKVKCQHAFGSQRNSSLLRHYFRSIFVVFLWELSNVPKKKKKIQAGLSHIFNQEKKKKKLVAWMCHLSVCGISHTSQKCLKSYCLTKQILPREFFSSHMLPIVNEFWLKQ